MILQQQSETPSADIDIYCAARGAEAEAQALQVCRKLQQAGLAVEIDLSGSAFGKQMKRADRSGAPLCLILGDEEAQNQTLQLKWLESGEQEVLAQSALIERISDLQKKIMLSKPAKRV
jgi:histidyl-tRNA synthetase